MAPQKTISSIVVYQGHVMYFDRNPSDNSSDNCHVQVEKGEGVDRIELTPLAWKFLWVH